MSDLISRSELLKEIEKYKFGAISNNAEREYVKTTILNFIECQPTAYDTDNVVEELEADSSVKLYGSGNSDNYLIPVKKAIEIVQEVAEEYKGGWIACSERLPEESGYYLVTYHDWSDGNFLPKYDDTYVRRLHYQISEHFVGWNYPKNVDDRAENDCHKEVIAWQPLPEPFKERD